MKILDKQESLVSNYDVYQHLIDQREAHRRMGRKIPGNLDVLGKQVITYLQQKPGPLARQEETKTYNDNSAKTLLEKLRPLSLGLEKGEFLQIMNLRPSNTVQLSAVVEDLEERLSEEKQQALLEIIAEVLGRDEPTDNDPEAMETIENGN